MHKLTAFLSLIQHLLEKMGSFEYTRNILKRLDAEARAEVCLFCLLEEGPLQICSIKFIHVPFSG